jgi:hypothetical protein
MLINKTIYKLSDYIENFRLSTMSCWAESSQYENHEVLFIDGNLDDQVVKREEVRRSIYNKIISGETKTIEDGSKLYFDPSSKFPRFKLEDKPYKRVIKQKSSDYTVIKGICRPNEINTTYSSQYFLWEFEDALYLAPTNFVCYSMKIDEFVLKYNTFYREQFAKNVENSERYREFKSAFELKNRVLPDTFRIVYLFDLGKNKIWADIYNDIFTNKYIFDSTLDSIVSKTNPKLDEDTVDQIIGLLNSPDSESQVLGLKMLSLSDYMSEPNLAKFILYKTKNNWCSNPKSKSTGINTMLTNLNNAINEMGHLDRRFHYWSRSFTDCYDYNYDDYCKRRVTALSIQMTKDQWNFLYKISEKYGFK